MCSYTIVVSGPRKSQCPTKSQSRLAYRDNRISYMLTKNISQFATTGCKDVYTGASKVLEFI